MLTKIYYYLIRYSIFFFFAFFLAWLGYTIADPVWWYLTVSFSVYIVLRDEVIRNS